MKSKYGVHDCQTWCPVQSCRVIDDLPLWTVYWHKQRQPCHSLQHQSKRGLLVGLSRYAKLWLLACAAGSVDILRAHSFPASLQAQLVRKILVTNSHAWQGWVCELCVSHARLDWKEHFLYMAAQVYETVSERNAPVKKNWGCITISIKLWRWLMCIAGSTYTLPSIKGPIPQTPPNEAILCASPSTFVLLNSLACLSGCTTGYSPSPVRRGACFSLWDVFRGHGCTRVPSFLGLGCIEV